MGRFAPIFKYYLDMSKKIPKLDVGMREEALTNKQNIYKPFKLQSYEDNKQQAKRKIREVY